MSIMSHIEKKNHVYAIFLMLNPVKRLAQTMC
jgi:hypothetical protein